MKKFWQLMLVVMFALVLVGCQNPSEKPDEPNHEHKFVEGKCECGEKEPTENKPQTPNNGGMNCSMGFVSLLPLLGAAALLLIKKRK